jgi:DNA-binding transcriptional LysR family regulator
MELADLQVLLWLIELHFSPDPLRAISDDYDLIVYWGDAIPGREGFSRALLRTEQRVMTSPDYLAAHGTPTSIAELSEHRLIQHTREPGAWPLLRGGQVSVQDAHRVGDLYLLGCMVGAGIGLGLIPRQGLTVHPSIQGLVPVLEEEVGATGVMRFFAPIRTEHSAAAVIVTALEQLADQLDGLH